MMRLIVLACLVAGLVALIVPAGALADGDPGSDVLYYQDFFSGADDDISIAQQAEMGKLLLATTALHAPVRVAIIGRRDDLGTVTQLWRAPASYADYLGSELELAYSGRLIVVMPNGVALFWYHHGVEPLSGISTGPSADQLEAAANAAVLKVESATAGISAATLAKTAGSQTVEKAAVSAAGTSAGGAIAAPAASAGAGEPKATGTATNVNPAFIVLGLVIVLGAVFWAPPVWRRRGILKQGGIAVPGLVIGVVALGALVLLAVVVHGNGSTTYSADAEATNPDLASVTSLGDSQDAPDFTLTDEAGQKLSLKQYRGKVVILSFTDDECQTICPLTTQAMVDARDSLGTAKRDVQLLGVDANWRSTSVEDVGSYTELHGLEGQWHFLTGSIGQLNTVWADYGVKGDLDSSSDLIEHTPAVYIIGPDGKLRYSSITYSSYSAISQYGQELAQAAASLLPSHPKISTHFSYSEITGISPSTKTTLAKVGGGSVTLGTRKHLFLFFDSWDQQSTPIKAQMLKLNAYALEARKLGLPSLIAVDEASVEPNPGAVTEFLAGMHLDYPVVIDTTGRLADGYGVEGEPWFVLAIPGAHNIGSDPTATTPWEQEVYTQGWPSLETLRTSIPAALKPPAASASAKVAKRELAPSPPALASLHAQASQILSTGADGLVARLKALRGHPVVVNVWASDCAPCQREFGWFATESAKYGSKVAFLGVDYDDVSRTDALGFLARHHIYYPSYALSDGSVPSTLLPGGVQGTPTTVFFSASGVREYIQIGEYSSEQQLDQQIQSYAG